MTRRSLQVLAAVVTGLVLLLIVLQSTDDGDGTTRRLLLPGFDAVANDATEIRILGADDAGTVTIRRAEQRWVVAERAGYPADIGKLRQLIIALAEAEVVEEKTSNPEHYARLGVDSPADGGAGSLLTVAGPGHSFAVILGNTAQGRYRYVRVADQPVTLLIDRNPEVPSAASDWLQPDILDIGSARIQQVSILHADGESIVLRKQDAEQDNFDVLDVPDGRELSYPAVGNGIAAVLANLQLDDVRPSVDAAPSATATFDTWDGLMITAAVVTDGDTSWIAFAAASGEGESPVADEAAAINARVQNWQYRLPDYKKNLFVRRWDDLLKAAD